jgi:hypothetical protein
MDGRKNNGGARPGAGPKGYGKMKFIEEQFDIYAPVFWKKLGEGLERGDQWALSEFNKIQVKMIPQKLSGDPDGAPIQFVSGFNYIKPDEDNNTDNQAPA